MVMRARVILRIKQVHHGYEDGDGDGDGEVDELVKDGDLGDDGDGDAGDEDLFWDDDDQNTASGAG